MCVCAINERRRISIATTCIIELRRLTLGWVDRVNSMNTRKLQMAEAMFVFLSFRSFSVLVDSFVPVVAFSKDLIFIYFKFFVCHTYFCRIYIWLLLYIYSNDFASLEMPGKCWILYSFSLLTVLCASCTRIVSTQVLNDFQLFDSLFCTCCCYWCCRWLRYNERSIYIR